MHAIGHHRARAQARERADLHRAFGDHAVQVAVRTHFGARAQAHVPQPRERSDAHPVTQLHLAFQHHVGVDLHVGTDAHAATLVEARRVEQARALGAQRPCAAQLEGAFELGQLPGVIGALGLQRIVHGDDLGRVVLVGGHGEHVGEVVLALAVVGRQPRQPALQWIGLGGDDAGVDGADAALLVVGIAMLDDRRDLALFVADDAAVTGRILRLGHQYPQQALRIQQPAQGLGPGQRHVAVQHQHVHRFGDPGQGLLHRMAGAQPLGLFIPGQVVLPSEGRTHRLTAVAIDHVDTRWLQRACGVDHMGEHRPPAHRLQHLGQRRFHPLALAGSEDHHVQCLGHVQPDP